LLGLSDKAAVVNKSKACRVYSQGSVLMITDALNCCEALKYC